MRINCNAAQDLMQLYVEGLLSGDSKKLVDEHLANCESCKAKFVELQSINAELDGEEDVVGVSSAKPNNQDVETFKSFKRWLGIRRLVTVLLTAAISIAIVIGGIYYIESHESYIPYNESGITVSESGNVYTDKNYSCYHSSMYVTETAGDNNHYVQFMYLTSSIVSRHFEKKPEHKELFASFAESNGESIGDDGILRKDVVTEVYYLPEEYVVKQGLLNDKHSTLIPLDASEEEQQSIIQQMKAESTLLWKRN